MVFRTPDTEIIDSKFCGQLKREKSVNTFKSSIEKSKEDVVIQRSAL